MGYHRVWKKRCCDEEQKKKKEESDKAQRDCLLLETRVQARYGCDRCSGVPISSLQVLGCLCLFVSLFPCCHVSFFYFSFILASSSVLPFLSLFYSCVPSRLYFRLQAVLMHQLVCCCSLIQSEKSRLA